MAKKIKEINGIKYELPVAVVRYIEVLEYYHFLKIDTKVIEVHSGVYGDIKAIYPNFDSIPKEIIANPDEYIETVGVPIAEGLKKVQWLVVLCDETNNYYALPYPYWRVIPQDEINDDDDDEEVTAEEISDK